MPCISCNRHTASPIYLFYPFVGERSMLMLCGSCAHVRERGYCEKCKAQKNVYYMFKGKYRMENRCTECTSTNLTRRFGGRVGVV